jgi:hypothetical protein
VHYVRTLRGSARSERGGAADSSIAKHKQVEKKGINGRFSKFYPQLKIERAVRVPQVSNSGAVATLPTAAQSELEFDLWAARMADDLFSYRKGYPKE